MVPLLEKGVIYKWTTTGVKFVVKDEDVNNFDECVYLIKFINSPYVFEQLIQISHKFIINNQRKLIRLEIK